MTGLKVEPSLSAGLQGHILDETGRSDCIFAQRAEPCHIEMITTDSDSGRVGRGPGTKHRARAAVGAQVDKQTRHPTTHQRLGVLGVAGAGSAPLSSGFFSFLFLFLRPSAVFNFSMVGFVSK